MYNCVDHCVSFIDRLANAGYLVFYLEEVVRLKEIVSQGDLPKLLEFIKDTLIV